MPLQQHREAQLAAINAELERLTRPRPGGNGSDHDDVARLDEIEEQLERLDQPGPLSDFDEMDDVDMQWQVLAYAQSIKVSVSILKPSVPQRSHSVGVAASFQLKTPAIA